MQVVLKGEDEFVATLAPDWPQISQQIHETLGHKVTPRDQVMVADTVSQAFSNFEVESHRTEGEENQLYVAVGAMYKSPCFDMGSRELSRLWDGIVHFLANSHDLADEMTSLGNRVKNRHVEQLSEAVKRGLLPKPAADEAADVFPMIWRGLVFSSLTVEAWRRLAPDTQSLLGTYVERGFNRDPVTWQVISKSSDVCGVNVSIDHAWRTIVLVQDPYDFFLPTTFALEGVEAVDGCRRWLDLWKDQDDEDKLSSAVQSLNRLAVMNGNIDFKPLIEHV